MQNKVLFVYDREKYNGRQLLKELFEYRDLIDIYSTNNVINSIGQDFDYIIVKKHVSDNTKNEIERNFKCPVINSIESQRICDDKWLTWERLKDKYNLPKTSLESKDIEYPIVVKNRFGSMGEQVWKANNERELFEIEQGTNKDKLIYQQYIECGAKHIRAIIINGEYIGAMEVKATSNDFKSNAHLGGKAIKIDLEPNIKAMCENIAKDIDIFYCGIDLLVGDKVYLCEINANAITETFDQATGINTTKIYLEKLKENKICRV